MMWRAIKISARPSEEELSLKVSNVDGRPRSSPPGRLGSAPAFKTATRATRVTDKWGHDGSMGGCKTDLRPTSAAERDLVMLEAEMSGSLEVGGYYMGSPGGASSVGRSPGGKSSVGRSPGGKSSVVGRLEMEMEMSVGGGAGGASTVCRSPGGASSLGRSPIGASSVGRSPGGKSSVVGRLEMEMEMSVGGVHGRSPGVRSPGVRSPGVKSLDVRSPGVRSSIGRSPERESWISWPRSPPSPLGPGRMSEGSVGSLEEWGAPGLPRKSVLRVLAFGAVAPH
jgi:hypothetical protein